MGKCIGNICSKNINFLPGSNLFLAFYLAGFLTYPLSCAFPTGKCLPVACGTRKTNGLSRIGFTVAGTVPDFHRIPFYRT